LNHTLVMDDVLPQLGLAVLLIGLGLPFLFWLVVRFPLMTGGLGLVGVVLELLRLLGEPGQPVRPSCGDSTLPLQATPHLGPRIDDGNGLRGPEIRL
jgi:hypothetical protein